MLVPANVAARGGWPWQVERVLEYLALINVSVLVFNLVPAFPLDGGRVLRSILWGTMGDLRRATRWASLFGRGFSWVLIALGVVEFLNGDLLSGIWMFLIGLFLGEAAASGYQQVLVRQALQGEPVRRLMDPAPVVAPPSLDLEHWVQEYVYRLHRELHFAPSDGRPTRPATTLPAANKRGRIMKYTHQRDNLGVEIDAHQCTLSPAEIDKIHAGIDALTKQVEHFPVASLHVLVERNVRTNDFTVKTDLFLTGETIVSGDHDAHVYPAFERCVQTSSETWPPTRTGWTWNRSARSRKRGRIRRSSRRRRPTWRPSTPPCATGTTPPSARPRSPTRSRCASGPAGGWSATRRPRPESASNWRWRTSLRRFSWTPSSSTTVGRRTCVSASGWKG